VAGVTSRGALTTGAKVVMLSEAVLGVTSLGADTTGANVVRLRVAFPITTCR
jgi:hypothetical protein